MPRVSAHLRSGGRLTGSRAGLAAGALCGVAMLTVAGCSSGSSPSAHHTTAAGRTEPARQAVRQAVVQGKQDTTALGDIDVQVTGSSSSSSTGTMQMEFKPSTVISSDVHVKSASRVVNMVEISAGNTLYLKLPSLTVATGKPWASVPSPAGTASAGQTGTTNPNPLQDIQLLYTSHDLHATGTQTVNGVRCSVYQGSYPASTALKGLKPSVIKSIGSTLHGSINETVWFDGQHQLRRLTSTQQVSGLTIAITLNITAINVPVHIAVPLTSQVAKLPESALSH
jgi:hypothetical protein